VGNGKDYETIEYWAKSTIVDFGQMAQRWSELKNKAIGNDLFPRYRIVYMDEKRQYQELKDGLTLASDKIILACEFLATRVGVNVFLDGVELRPEADGSRVLKPGNNRLGIWVRNVDSNLDPQYVDFKYFNVVSGGLSLKPPAQEGTPNQQLRFEVELSQPAPSGSKLEWYVDGKLTKSGLDFSISVSFPSEGAHTVEVRLVGADGKTALQAQGTATIRAKATPTFVPGSNLPVLQKMTSVSGSFKGKWSLKKWTAASGETTADSFLTFSIPASAGSTPPPVIAWSGTSFSGKRTWGLPTYGSTEEIEGTVTADGRTLTSLVWTLTSKAEGEGSGGVGAWNSDTVWSVRLQNIPIEQLVFEKATASSFTFSKYGAEVKPYLAEASYHTVTYRLGTKESEVTAVSGSIKWDDTSMQGMPGIILTMK